MLGIVQNFIGQVAGSINDSSNPLGLSQGQIDEINQILTLIKNLISDGIQRNDIQKMITLLGEVAEAIPELQAEIKEIVKGLKNIFKALFEDPDAMVSSPLNAAVHLESSTHLTQEVGERGMLTDTQLIDQLSPNAGPHDIMVDRLLLDKTSDDRLMLAEKILTIVNDKLILSQTNFDALTKGLSAIQRRSGLANDTSRIPPVMGG